LAQVAEGGALAFQIPSGKYAAVHQHMHEIADDPAWRHRMKTAKTALTIEEPKFYYEALADRVRTLDIWETEYYHIMEGPESIIDWISSTGLRPFLDALDRDEEQQQFIVKLRERVGQSYPRCQNSKVLFPFRRLFVIAYR
jgi:trans-aconitate 2-methyltransferase